MKKQQSEKQATEQLIKLLKPYGHEVRAKVLGATAILLDIPLRDSIETKHFMLVPKKKSPSKISAFGEAKTAVQWFRDFRCKVSYGTLNQRLRSGWEPEKAISTPPQI